VNRNKTPLSEKLLWNVQDCANAMSCHPNTIWNRVRAGNFVQPIKWDGKTVWRRSDVENFVERLAG
jgi:predicted DNA-binding transcriptional regulator AlpA